MAHFTRSFFRVSTEFRIQVGYTNPYGIFLILQTIHEKVTNIVIIAHT